jgi:hypothetical protein
MLCAQLTFLHDAANQNQGLSSEDKANLLLHLRQLTQYNKDLIESQAKNVEQIKDLQNHIKKVHDKAQNEVDKAEKLREFWRLAY